MGENPYQTPIQPYSLRANPTRAAERRETALRAKLTTTRNSKANSDKIKHKKLGSKMDQKQHDKITIRIMLSSKLR